VRKEEEYEVSLASSKKKRMRINKNGKGDVTISN